ncbi:hypothetical protein MOBT1_001009 [Malassezia obtusa]|uniref:Proteasome maturation factor UMP1 n=1 Tax=Malassezia obtusa TaxID=76774 RepID=A0AAF0IRD3_9BASI|nr:hypothetical protein MOBT1_001009 [Malassezia obtusa]
MVRTTPLTQSSWEIVPRDAPTHAQTDAHTTAHPEIGVHDAMRHGLRSLHAETSASSYHPVQNRLDNWDATQRNWKLASQRNIFGMGMPIRSMMERKIVSKNPHMPARGVAQVHLDILDGRDEELDTLDFLPSGVSGDAPDIHTAMERKLGVH